MRKMCGIGIRPMMMVALMLCALGTKAQEKLTLTLDQAIEIALSDYLHSLGFAHEWGRESRYVLNDCYGQCICDLSVRVEENTTRGVIKRNIITPDIDKMLSADSPFADLDSAVASVNTILATYVASVDAAAMNVLNKITNSRSALLLDTTFNVRTLSTFTEDGRQRMIEALEKELEQLKGIG